MDTPATSNGGLDDLEIKRFRAFNHLKIERLGHVNLIVGKNNVGKSTLLEALRLYATSAPFQVIVDIVRSRDEHQVNSEDTLDSREPPLTPALLTLFNGRQPPESIMFPIEIGPTRGEKLTIRVEWFDERADPDQVKRLVQQDRLFAEGPDLVPVLLLTKGSMTRRLRLDRDLSILRRSSLFGEAADPTQPCVLVSANGFRGNETARMWDRIVLSEWEDEVLSALHILAPRIERLTFVGDDRRGERSARAKVLGAPGPVPLRSLGDGVNRLMGLLLALVDAKSGLLLIDEIENGIHYAALPDLWRSLIKLALRLNVQIVATTHSWDCVTAFQRATLENTESDGVLTRLERTESGFRAVQFDEDELNIAAESRIEVR